MNLLNLTESEPESESAESESESANPSLNLLDLNLLNLLTMCSFENTVLRCFSTSSENRTIDCVQWVEW